MTKKYREYAKSRIEYLLKISSFVFDERDKEALEAAIKALSQEPICDRDCEHCNWTECPIEPCDDVVSREDALMCLTGIFKLPLNYKPEDLIALISKRIKDLPSVTQKSAKDYLDMADRKAKKIKDALTDNPQKGDVKNV